MYYSAMDTHIIYFHGNKVFVNWKFIRSQFVKPYPRDEKITNYTKHQFAFNKIHDFLTANMYYSALDTHTINFHGNKVFVN